MCEASLLQSLSCLQSLTSAGPCRVCVQCNTAPLCLHKEQLLFQHIPVILIPSNVSVSKTVTQSLPRSLSLSICQSAVCHSLIQSAPRLLSLSVSLSLGHSIPLSLFAHLTSSSLAHLHFPPIHHSTHLSSQVCNCQQPFSLPHTLLILSKIIEFFCFVLFSLA